jgi:hypothetical protein
MSIGLKREVASMGCTSFFLEKYCFVGYSRRYGEGGQKSR